MPKKGGSDLGRALQRRQNPKVGVQRPSDVYVQEWAGPGESELGLQSALDMNDLNSIAEQADLAQTRFIAEKEKTVLLQTTSVVLPGQLDSVALSEQRKNFNNLTVPRRPIWTPGMPLDELDKLERTTFQQWRRQLALLEENEHLLLTPFEKNLEVWKQLWRVLERSDLVVQILDSRDPLLFRSPDLEKYVDEFADHKLNILLMNKADLLSDPQREAWAKYFRSNGIRVLFFSARAEMIKLEEEALAGQEEILQKLSKLNPYSGLEESISDEEDEEDDEEDEDDETTATDAKKPSKGIYDAERLKRLLQGDDAGDEEGDSEDALLARMAASRSSQMSKSKKKAKSVQFASSSAPVDSEASQTEEEPAENNAEAEEEEHEIKEVDTSLEAITGRILTRTELFDYFYTYVRAELGPKEKITVGMVGYPNVGKSSTVNVLAEKKKVAVSSTPGKTKHFQTLQIHNNITLCDCPGLVFPTFMSSKAEMFCNGLLRIAEMKECIAPVSIVTRQIPRRELEYVYGIHLPKKIDPQSIITTGDGKAYAPKAKLSPQQLLAAYADLRGFYITAGKPDNFRTARLVLNDYLDGKILFCRAPPSDDQKAFSKLTKYNNPDLRVVAEDAPIRPSNNAHRPVKPVNHVRSGADLDDDDDDDTNEPQELSPEDLINLRDPEEMQRLTGAHIQGHVKPKHARINRKQELRRQKKGQASQERAQQGIHVDFKPAVSKGVRTLPTNVKLTPGRRAAGADPNSTANGRTFVAAVKK